MVSNTAYTSGYRFELIALERFGLGALMQIAAYPRELVRWALAPNSATVIPTHCDPAGTRAVADQ